MKKIFIIISTLFVLLTGCSNGEKNEEEFVVYTSFYAMNDFAKMIAGDRADIKTLIPQGVEVHDWEPGTKDMIALNEADVFIYSGLNMEPWVESVLDAVSNEKMIVVEASRGITPIVNGEHADPHVWLNPKNALIELENIAEALAEANEENADFYRNNLEQVKVKMTELDNQYKSVFEKVKDSEMIVTHGAFGYLCEAYGLKQYAMEGLNGESDPSSAIMKDIIDYVNKNNKKALFYIESEGDKMAKVIADETGIKLYPLNTFENGKEDENYFEVMEENLRNIKDALTGNEQ